VYHGKAKRDKMHLFMKQTPLFLCYCKAQGISGACDFRNLKTLKLEEAAVTFPTVPISHSLSGRE
jgi:hypothetical protein